MTEQPTTTMRVPSRLSRPVTVRVMLPALVLTAAIAAGGGLGLGALVLPHGAGPQGPAGPTGVAGPRGHVGAVGPPGHADEEAVLSAIDDDPQRVAQAVQGSLDPDPADVDSRVDDLETNLQSLCSELQLSDALANDVLPCP